MTENKTRILFLIRSISQFLYLQSIVQELINQGCSIIILFDPNWSKGTSLDDIKKFEKENKNFNYGWMVIRNDLYRNFIFPLRELLSYRRYLITKNQSLFYTKRWQNYLAMYFKLLSKISLFNYLLKTKKAYQLIKSWEKLIPEYQPIVGQIKTLDPDIIVASPANLRFSEENEYLKAAKKLNIPTIIPVLSWDNLTTKGLFHFLPDRLLVWNKTHQVEAEVHHQIPSNKITIVGSYVFDKWFDSLKPSLKKVAFFKKHQLNHNYPLILYLGSSANIALDETWLIKKVYNLLKTNYPNLQLMIRPHPANAKIYSDLKLKDVVVYPKVGQLAYTEDAAKDFYNCLYYSQVVLSINTSAMIETIIADKPVIALTEEIYKKTQLETQHFQHLSESGCLYLTPANETLIKTVEKLFHNLDPKETKRKNFVKEFIRPKGLNKRAGKIAAEEILSMLS